MKRYGLLMAAVMFCAPVTGLGAGLPWYAGVDAGASSLRPETLNSPFTLDSSVSFGAGLFVGYDVSKRFSLELGYNYLGSATLQGNGGKTDIGYSALSAGALLYLFGDASDIAERNGFAGYLRLGLSSMDNRATIPLEREDNLAILAGVGVEWPFSRQLSLRGEVTSFDGDAQLVRAAVVFRPRADLQRGTPVSRTPPAPRPQTQQAPKREPSIIRSPTPSSAPSVSSSASPSMPSNCSAPAVGEPADARGCALFSGQLRGVEFTSGTASLTPVATQLLDRLAQNLMRYPNTAIEIQAHTESFGSEVRAREIAKQRTLAVARHLAGRGVPVRRLKARAFGHSQPIANDATTGGRRQNNRIELRVLR